MKRMEYMRNGEKRTVLQCDICRRNEDKVTGMYGVISRAGVPKGHVCGTCWIKLRRGGLSKSVALARQEENEAIERTASSATAAMLEVRVSDLEEEMAMVIKRIQAIDPPRTERVVHCPDDVKKGDRVWVEERSFRARPKYTCAATAVSWDSAGYVKGDAWSTGNPTVSSPMSSMESKRRAVRKRQEEREKRIEEWRRTRAGDTPSDMVAKTTFDIPDPMNGEEDE